MIKVIINNKEFDNFSQYTLNLKHNTVASTFVLYGLGQFLPMPFTYAPIKIYRDNFLVFTGVCLNSNIETQIKPVIRSISGYSTPGILEDVNIPPSLYPLQNDNLSLRQITQKLLAKFNISWDTKGPQIASVIDKPFVKTIAEPTDTVKGYINNLASQRGVLVTHNRFGQLILKKGEIIAPSEIMPNIISSNLTLNGQALHSEITVIRQASTENPDAGQATEYNKYCNVFRPLVKTLDSGDIFDVGEAAKNLLRAELQTIVLSLRSKDFIMPGYSIRYEVPESGLDIVNWFIDETIVEGSINGEIYTYNCVPNDCYK